MKPRQILPKTTYMVTRRCTQRELWLVPSELLNSIVRYCVAAAAEKFGIHIHACCFMSNHWHCVLTDELGCLPDFTHWVHLFIGKCVNNAYKREETLWSSDEPCYEELCDDGSVLGAIVYCVTNPVAAGLVACHDEWPGWCSSPADWLASDTPEQRPPVYFSKQGAAAEHIELALVRPPIFGGLSDEQLSANVANCVAARERELAKSHKKFLGASAVLAQRRGRRPDTPAAPRSAPPRFGANCRSILAEVSERLDSFQKAYRRARERYKKHNRNIEWPAGTWAMRRIANVRVARLSTCTRVPA